MAGNKSTSDHLKAAFKLEDMAGHCVIGVKKKDKEKKTAVESTLLVCPGTVLIPGILRERDISSNYAAMQN
eukprot:745927-Ditylum_brightwellii.AAC.1